MSLMADFENITLEHLRALRAAPDEFRREVRDFIVEQRITNAHIAPLVRHEAYSNLKLAEIESRLGRVEKRLDLEPDK